MSRAIPFIIEFVSESHVAELIQHQKVIDYTATYKWATTAIFDLLRPSTRIRRGHTPRHGQTSLVYKNSGATRTMRLRRPSSSAAPLTPKPTHATAAVAAAARAPAAVLIERGHCSRPVLKPGQRSQGKSTSKSSLPTILTSVLAGVALDSGLTTLFYC